MTSRSEGEGCQRFCYNSTKASAVKSVTMGPEGIDKCSKLCDVIADDPQSEDLVFVDWVKGLMTRTVLSVHSVDP
jgi:hypothetical protein